MLVRRKMKRLRAGISAHEAKHDPLPILLDRLKVESSNPSPLLIRQICVAILSESDSSNNQHSLAEENHFLYLTLLLREWYFFHKFSDSQRKQILREADILALAHDHYELYRKQGLYCNTYHLLRSYELLSNHMKLDSTHPILLSTTTGTITEMLNIINTIMNPPNNNYELLISNDNVEDIWLFCELLQSIGDNLNAAIWVQYAIYHFNDHPDVSKFELTLGAIYKSLGLYEKANEMFFSAVERNGLIGGLTRADMMMVICRCVEQSQNEDEENGHGNTSSLNDHHTTHHGTNNHQELAVNITPYHEVFLQLEADGLLPNDMDYEKWQTSAETWRSLGDKFYTLHLYTLATDLYTVALSRDPAAYCRGSLWFRFARACSRCGRMADARLAIQQAMSRGSKRRQLQSVLDSWAAESPFPMVLKTLTLESLIEWMPIQTVDPSTKAFTRFQSNVRGYLVRKHLHHGKRLRNDITSRMFLRTTLVIRESWLDRLPIPDSSCVLVGTFHSNWMGAINGWILTDVLTDRSRKLKLVYPFMPSRDCRTKSRKYRLQVTWEVQTSETIRVGGRVLLRLSFIDIDEPTAILTRTIGLVFQKSVGNRLLRGASTSNMFANNGNSGTVTPINTVVTTPHMYERQASFSNLNGESMRRPGSSQSNRSVSSDLPDKPYRSSDATANVHSEMLRSLLGNNTTSANSTGSGVVTLSGLSGSFKVQESTSSRRSLAGLVSTPQSNTPVGTNGGGMSSNVNSGAIVLNGGPSLTGNTSSTNAAGFYRASYLDILNVEDCMEAAVETTRYAIGIARLVLRLPCHPTNQEAVPIDNLKTSNISLSSPYLVWVSNEDLVTQISLRHPTLPHYLVIFLPREHIDRATPLNRRLKTLLEALVCDPILRICFPHQRYKSIETLGEEATENLLLDALKGSRMTSEGWTVNPFLIDQHGLSLSLMGSGAVPLLGVQFEHYIEVRMENENDEMIEAVENHEASHIDVDKLHENIASSNDTTKFNVPSVDSHSHDMNSSIPSHLPSSLHIVSPRTVTPRMDTPSPGTLHSGLRGSMFSAIESPRGSLTSPQLRRAALAASSPHPPPDGTPTRLRLALRSAPTISASVSIDIGSPREFEMKNTEAPTKVNDTHPQDSTTSVVNSQILPPTVKKIQEKDKRVPVILIPESPVEEQPSSINASDFSSSSSLMGSSSSRINMISTDMDSISRSLSNGESDDLSGKNNGTHRRGLTIEIVDNFAATRPSTSTVTTETTSTATVLPNTNDQHSSLERQSTSTLGTTSVSSTDAIPLSSRKTLSSSGKYTMQIAETRPLIGSIHSDRSSDRLSDRTSEKSARNSPAVPLRRKRHALDDSSPAVASNSTRSRRRTTSYDESETGHLSARTRSANLLISHNVGSAVGSPAVGNITQRKRLPSSGSLTAGNTGTLSPTSMAAAAAEAEMAEITGAIFTQLLTAVITSDVARSLSKERRKRDTLAGHAADHTIFNVLQKLLMDEITQVSHMIGNEAENLVKQVMDTAIERRVTTLLNIVETEVENEELKVLSNTINEDVLPPITSAIDQTHLPITNLINTATSHQQDETNRETTPIEIPQSEENIVAEVDVPQSEENVEKSVEAEVDVPQSYLLSNIDDEVISCGVIESTVSTTSTDNYVVAEVSPQEFPLSHQPISELIVSEDLPVPVLDAPFISVPPNETTENSTFAHSQQPLLTSPFSAPEESDSDDDDDVDLSSLNPADLSLLGARPTPKTVFRIISGAQPTNSTITSPSRNSLIHAAVAPVRHQPQAPAVATVFRELFPSPLGSPVSKIVTAVANGISPTVAMSPNMPNLDFDDNQSVCSQLSNDTSPSHAMTLQSHHAAKKLLLEKLTRSYDTAAKLKYALRCHSLGLPLPDPNDEPPLLDGDDNSSVGGSVSGNESVASSAQLAPSLFSPSGDPTHHRRVKRRVRFASTFNPLDDGSITSGEHSSHDKPSNINRGARTLTATSWRAGRFDVEPPIVDGSLVTGSRSLNSTLNSSLSSEKLVAHDVAHNNGSTIGGEIADELAILRQVDESSPGLYIQSLRQIQRLGYVPTSTDNSNMGSKNEDHLKSRRRPWAYAAYWQRLLTEFLSYHATGPPRLQPDATDISQANSGSSQRLYSTSVARPPFWELKKKIKALAAALPSRITARLGAATISSVYNNSLGLPINSNGSIADNGNGIPSIEELICALAEARGSVGAALERLTAMPGEGLTSGETGGNHPNSTRREERLLLSYAAATGAPLPSNKKKRNGRSTSEVRGTASGWVGPAQLACRALPVRDMILSYPGGEDFLASIDGAGGGLVSAPETGRSLLSARRMLSAEDDMATAPDFPQLAPLEHRPVIASNNPSSSMRSSLSQTVPSSISSPERVSPSKNISRSSHSRQPTSLPSVRDLDDPNGLLFDLSVNSTNVRKKASFFQLHTNSGSLSRTASGSFSLNSPSFSSKDTVSIAAAAQAAALAVENGHSNGSFTSQSSFTNYIATNSPSRKPSVRGQDAIISAQLADHRDAPVVVLTRRDALRLAQEAIVSRNQIR